MVARDWRAHAAAGQLSAAESALGFVSGTVDITPPVATDRRRPARLRADYLAARILP
jgi:hypothetical protein